jgi:hypothetical protein
MSKGNRWALKSLAIGAAIALMVLVLFYGFLTVHTELGVSRASAYKLAIVAFFVGAVSAVIYFRFRNNR